MEIQELRARLACLTQQNEGGSRSGGRTDSPQSRDPFQGQADISRLVIESLDQLTVSENTAEEAWALSAARGSQEGIESGPLAAKICSQAWQGHMTGQLDALSQEKHTLTAQLSQVSQLTSELQEEVSPIHLSSCL